MEMISVIIPLFNKESYVSKAIGSVLAQSYRNFELIIVNDGSTDRSAAIAKAFIDDRIRCYCKENGGVSSARNFGIKKALYEWVAFLDADDWWDPGFLETLVDLKKRYPSAGIYAGKYVQVAKGNKVVHLDRFPGISSGYFDFFSHLYSVCSSSILVKKQAFEICGYFDERLTHGEDTDMWIRIALQYDVCYTDEVVAYYNIFSNPLTRSVGVVPPIWRSFISKIDLYVIDDRPDWNEFLIKKKLNSLRYYFQRYPFDKDIRRRISEIPPEIRSREGLGSIESLAVVFLFKKIFYLSPRRFLAKALNLVLLTLRKYGFTSCF